MNRSSEGVISKSSGLPYPGLWAWVFLLLVSGGAIASFVSAVTHAGPAEQSDGITPWGLCAGLNLFCGVALAAGTLCIATVAHIGAWSSWRAISRASLPIAWAGYMVAMLGALSGLPWNERLSPTISGAWSPRSVLSGAVWTLLLLTLLMLLEFLPDRVTSAVTNRVLVVLRHLQVSLLILAAGIAILHQQGLTHVIAISRSRFSPFWSGPKLSLLFFLSSVCVGLAVLLFASWRSGIAFGQRMPLSVMSRLASVLGIAVFLYLAVRLTDLVERGLSRAMFSLSRESGLLLIELALFLLGMMWVSAPERDPRRIYVGSTLIIAGVIANRLNTSITALEASTGEAYRPHWIEVLITLSLVSVGIAAVAICAKHLPMFGDIRDFES